MVKWTSVQAREAEKTTKTKWELTYGTPCIYLLYFLYSYYLKIMYYLYSNKYKLSSAFRVLTIPALHTACSLPVSGTAALQWWVVTPVTLQQCSHCSLPILSTIHTTAASHPLHQLSRLWHVTCHEPRHVSRVRTSGTVSGVTRVVTMTN